MIIHNNESSLAGKTVKFKKRPGKIVIEDWVDRWFKCSWLDVPTHPLHKEYMERVMSSDIPFDNHVLKGYIDGVPTLVHISELDIEELPEEIEYNMSNLEVAKCFIGNALSYLKGGDIETVEANLTYIKDLLEHPNVINKKYTWGDFK